MPVDDQTEPSVLYLDPDTGLTYVRWNHGRVAYIPRQHFERLDELARRVCSYADSVVRGAYLDGCSNDEYIGGVDDHLRGIRVSTLHGLSQSVEALRNEISGTPTDERGTER